MRDIRKMSIEYKTMAVFGCLALVLSMLSGLIAHVGFGNAILRSLVLGIIFSGLGYGLMLILRKYVPEIIDAIQNIQSSNKDEIADIRISPEENKASSSGKAGKTKADSETGSMGETAQGMPDAASATAESGFSELKRDDFPQYNAMKDQATETLLNTGEGKLGKHIVVNEKETFGKYEPKLMAQAIRTMLSKEE